MPEVICLSIAKIWKRMPDPFITFDVHKGFWGKWKLKINRYSINNT